MLIKILNEKKGTHWNIFCSAFEIHSYVYEKKKKSARTRQVYFWHHHISSTSSSNFIITLPQTYTVLLFSDRIILFFFLNNFINDYGNTCTSTSDVLGTFFFRMLSNYNEKKATTRSALFVRSLRISIPREYFAMMIYNSYIMI